VRSWFGAVLSEEYDFIPYLVVPEYVYNYLPRDIRKLRLNVHLPKDTIYSLKLEQNNMKAVVSIEGTKYRMILQKYENKWMIVSKYNM